ncbi:MAG: hypothetical protein LH609_20450 [Rudanella sp.]|nr:hypothetical protein [Rudanella sp.]
MFPRSWIAVLLFLNYLVVVSGGYMNAPGEPRYVIEPIESHQLHGSHSHSVDITPFLEEINAEEVANYAENTRKANEHHLSVLKLMDAHCLPNEQIQPLPTPAFWERIVVSAYRLCRSEGVCAAIFSPPWQG